jgi:hypothetical protein
MSSWPLFPKKHGQKPKKQGNSRIDVLCHSPKKGEQKTKTARANGKRTNLNVTHCFCVPAVCSVTPKNARRHLAKPEAFFT